jgi:LPS-assembly protein
MRLAPGSRFFVAAGAALALCAAAPGVAQPADGLWGLKLRPSSIMLENPSADSERAAPAYVSGDRITGQTDLRTIVEGNAVVRRGQSVVRAQRLASTVLKATFSIRATVFSRAPTARPSGLISTAMTA